MSFGKLLKYGENMNLKELLQRRVDNQEVERLRKYKLAVKISVVTLAAMTFFIIKDFIEQDGFELLVEVLVCLIVCICLIFLRKKKNDLIIYRFALIFISLCFLYAVWIGSGDGSVLYWLFFVPLTFIYFLGEYEGLFWTVILGILLALSMINPFGFPIYEYAITQCIVFLGSFVFVSAITFLIEQNRSDYAAKLIEQNGILEAEKQKSEKALYEIKVLQGLLPICSYCKKIRGDKGYWQDVAVYIQNHSNAEFTHSICPDCEEEVLKELSSSEDE